MTTEEKPKASKLRVTPPSFSTFKDDCSRPACDDMTSMMKQAQERSSHTAANKGTAVAASQTPSVECPPNSAFLGRLSWTLLHSMVRIGLPFVFTSQVTQNPKLTITNSSCVVLTSPIYIQAAWYPDQPNDQDKKHMTNFMSALARFYPCPWCATDFQANIEQKPVQ